MKSDKKPLKKKKAIDEKPSLDKNSPYLDGNLIRVKNLNDKAVDNGLTDKELKLLINIMEKRYNFHKTKMLRKQGNVISTSTFNKQRREPKSGKKPNK